MAISSIMRRRRLMALMSVVFGSLSIHALAQQSVVKLYTSADGLGHNRVYRIVSDTQGFLWFCTLDGLTRFDGQHFVNFSSSNGAPFVAVNDLLELPGGDYWIASRGQGIIRFAANGPLEPENSATLKARFRPYSIGNEPSSNFVNALHRDRLGMVWIGTRAGLYRLVEKAGSVTIRPVPVSLPGHSDRELQILALAEDPDGSIYAAISFGVVRFLPEGGRIFYPAPGPDYDPGAGAVLFRDGVLWFGNWRGLFLLRPSPATRIGAGVQVDDALSHAPDATSQHPPSLPSRPDQALFLRFGEDPAKNYVAAIHPMRDGRIWIASLVGTFEYKDGVFRRILRDAPFNYALEIGEDAAGNAWLATDYAGVAKIESRGFVNFAQSDGIGSVPQCVFIDKAGEPLILSWPRQLAIPDGERFRMIQMKLASDVSVTDVCPFLNDRAGEWWLGTTGGLYRFPKVAQPADLANVTPKTVFTHAQGLGDDKVSHPFEDSVGDIWVGGFDSAEPTISRWERRTEHLYRYSAQNGLPSNGGNLMGIAEDRDHNIWFAFSEGGLARYRNGQFRVFQERQGLPSSKIAGIIADHNGRIWCSISGGGLVRIEDSNGERLKLTAYRVTQSLTSYLFVGSPLFADARGRVYVGLPHGVDRLDPSTGAVTHYGLADGVPDGPINTITTDGAGTIWISGRKSVAHLLPQTEQKKGSSAVLISGLRVSGVAYQVPPVGAPRLKLQDLPYQMNSLQIDFLTLSLNARERPLFQYKLEGAEDSAWSDPTPMETVNYGNLQPGNYRFQVRIAALGDYSGIAPAQLTFRILPPFWRRAWFLGAVGTIALIFLFAFERYRADKMQKLRYAMAALRTANEERIAEIERVRKRIAADLHDDIGSSLTQISVLSEVARQQVTQSSNLARPLEIIAGSSRELIDSMSDIVWAINPQRDHLSDLVHRMRRFASDTLTARNIRFTMDLPLSDQDMKIEGNLRREVFLIFKEALNNAVRHSGCTSAEIALRLEDHALRLHVRDNGNGFDTSGASGGHGLASMRTRASELGAGFDIKSKPGEGSEITLDIPLKAT